MKTYQTISITSKSKIAKFIFSAAANQAHADSNKLDCKKQLFKFITGKAISSNAPLTVAAIEKFYSEMAEAIKADKIGRVQRDPRLLDFKKDAGFLSVRNGVDYIGRQLKVLGYRVKWGSLTIAQIKRAIANGTTDKLQQTFKVSKIEAKAEKQVTANAKHSQAAPMVQTSATTEQLADAMKKGEKNASKAALETLLENVSLPVALKALLKFHSSQEISQALTLTTKPTAKTKKQAKKIAATA